MEGGGSEVVRPGEVPMRDLLSNPLPSRFCRSLGPERESGLSSYRLSHTTNEKQTAGITSVSVIPGMMAVRILAVGNSRSIRVVGGASVATTQIATVMVGSVDTVNEGRRVKLDVSGHVWDRKANKKSFESQKN